MRILAVDPGTTQSALVCLEGLRPVGQYYDPNGVLVRRLAAEPIADLLCVEWLSTYGMPCGQEILRTCAWVGCFVQAWAPRPYRLVYRSTVRAHICESSRAKDSNVRAALIEWYGGKAVAIGRKAAPGLLYGFRSHHWPALALGLTVVERTVECGFTLEVPR